MAEVIKVCFFLLNIVWCATINLHAYPWTAPSVAIIMPTYQKSSWTRVHLAVEVFRNCTFSWLYVISVNGKFTFITSDICH